MKTYCPVCGEEIGTCEHQRLNQVEVILKYYDRLVITRKDGGK